MPPRVALDCLVCISETALDWNQSPCGIPSLAGRVEAPLLASSVGWIGEGRHLQPATDDACICS